MIPRNETRSSLHSKFYVRIGLGSSQISFNIRRKLVQKMKYIRIDEKRTNNFIQICTLEIKPSAMLNVFAWHRPAKVSSTF